MKQHFDYAQCDIFLKTNSQIHKLTNSQQKKWQRDTQKIYLLAML